MTLRPPPGADGLAELYAAAFDDEAWRNFGDLVARLTGVNTAGVWIAEKGQLGDFTLSEGHRESIQPYLAHFARIDPWSGSIMRAPRDSPYLANDHVDERELVKTEFYNDFARKFGHLRPMGALLTIAPDTVASLAVENRYSDTLFETSDKRSLAPWLPHIRTVIQLRRRVAAERTAGGLQAASLEALSFGVIICDAESRVLIMNAVAQQIMAALGTMQWSSRQAPSGAGEFRRLLGLVRDSATGGAGGVAPIKGSHGDTEVLALVSPLPSGLLNAAGGGHAMISLRRLRDAPAFTQAMLSSAFGLTPTQAEIALALFHGQSVEEIVVSRGIRMSTARTHLAAIFARTGTESQSDLMRLLASLPPVRLSAR